MRIDCTAPSEVHTHWMRLIQSSFGGDVKIINNNNKPVLNIDASPMASNALSYKQQFKVHKKQFGSTTQGTMKTSSTIVHPILIRVPFGQVKCHQPAFKLLQDNNCFLREHFVSAYFYMSDTVLLPLRPRRQPWKSGRPSVRVHSNVLYCHHSRHHHLPRGNLQATRHRRLSYVKLR